MSLNHSPAIVTDGLVLCLDAANVRSYPKSGTTWSDLIGSNNGTMENMTSANYSSDNGGVISFDGTDEYVSINSSSSLQTNIVSISAWIKRVSTGSRPEETYIHKESGTSPTGGYSLWIDRSTLKVIMRIRNSSNNFQTATSYSPISTGEWVNIVGIFDGSSIFIYLNGVQDFSTSSSISSLGSPAVNLSVGAIASAYSYNFNGNISSVKIYNRALTGDEVRQNYEATVGRYT